MKTRLFAESRAGGTQWGEVELVLRMPRAGGRSHQVAPAHLVNLVSPPLRPESRSCELGRNGDSLPGKGGQPSRTFLPHAHTCLQTQPDPSSLYPRFDARLISETALLPQPQPRSDPLSELSFLVTTFRTGTVSTFAPGSLIQFN